MCSAGGAGGARAEFPDGARELMTGGGTPSVAWVNLVLRLVVVLLGAPLRRGGFPRIPSGARGGNQESRGARAHAVGGDPRSVPWW
eukprot:1523808-Lingulodinium_polyedra.AAC.1